MWPCSDYDIVQHLACIGGGEEELRRCCFPSMLTSWKRYQQASIAASIAAFEGFNVYQNNNSGDNPSSQK